MGSASRAALASGIAAFERRSGVTLEAAQQLFAAVRAIEGSAQLRGLLADPTLAATERAALVARVFGSIDAAASGILTDLASERWSTPSEFVDGLEEIAIRAAASASPKTGIVAELFAVEDIVSGNAELELALGSKLATQADKAALVERILSGKVSDATIAIVSHLVQCPRGRRVGALLARAADIVADAAGAVVATVTVAAPLDAKSEKALVADLTARVGRPPRIHYLIDPSIIGGVRIRVGDVVIDGTISTRLNELRLKLAG